MLVVVLRPARVLCQLQLGGLSPAVEVRSSLGRARITADPFEHHRRAQSFLLSKSPHPLRVPTDRDCVRAQVTAAVIYCCCRRSSSPAKSRREAPPSPQISNPVVEKAPSRRAEPDEQLQFQGGELR